MCATVMVLWVCPSVILQKILATTEFVLLDKQVGIYMWQKAGGGLRPADESQLQVRQPK